MSEIIDVFGEEVAAAVDTPLVVIKGSKGDPGKDGHSPVVTATKSGKTTTISVDGAAIATVEDGADGKPGADGSDGITPTIGPNGNWYLGEEDTGKPSRGAIGAPGKDGNPGVPGKDGVPGVYYGTTQPTGDTHPVWIDPGGKHDDGGLLPAVTDADNGKVLRVVSSAWAAEDMPTGGTDMGITGATIGQIAKIAAVDESGVPTAWIPADMPSGGSSDFIIHGAKYEDEPVVLDKTFSQIKEAVQAGKRAIVQMTSDGNVTIMPLITNNSRMLLFGSVYNTNGRIFGISLIVTSSNVTEYFISTPTNNLDGTMPQVSMAAAPTADMQIATKKYVDDHAGVPSVTAAENGKFLRVVNGAWAAAAINDANGVSF